MASETPTASNGHITEDEASLYDRQIRLWGLEAQNKMRSSTVLVLSLRGVAHELIKNIVLAGIGRLIVADGETVTEEDLGSGFLFHEEAGAVGTERTAAALPQIASLNPLVSLTARPSLAPFVTEDGSDEDAIEAFLREEKVDVVVACDLSFKQMEAIDAGARKAGSRFFGAGTYGFYGYVFADLGEQYDFVFTPKGLPNQPAPALQKKTAAYASLASVVDRSKWNLPATQAAEGGSPFRGLTRNLTKGQQPGLFIGLLALWEFEKRHGALPTGAEGQQDELTSIAEELRKELAINEKALPAVDASVIEHLSSHATHFFPPTLAILGGMLAQDVLRVLSHKDTPITNFLAVDSLGGVGIVTRWAMGAPVDTAA
ncbi:E1 ubiquitin-activating protein aos1 [Vanrija albida]|uniref:Ubiquitin-like 1-activating enzyme E1A n=1 Tax=Vanrija albida TaxID=181172 RepID=A0ABR3QG12_9TREE